MRHNVIPGSTHELSTSLFRHMARLRLKIFRCLGYAASLHIFVLVLFLDAAVFTDVYLAELAFNIFYHHVDWDVVYNYHFCLCDVYLLSSDSSYSICCSNFCGVPVHKNMSSVKQRLMRNFPSIFTLLFSQFNLQICSLVLL